MNSFLRNTRAHANPISLALNAATVIIGITLIFFNPRFLPVSGLAIFAGYLVVAELIHIAVFGSNPFGMVLGAVVVVAAASVLKLSLGHGNFVAANASTIIIGLIALYMVKEVID